LGSGRITRRQFVWIGAFLGSGSVSIACGDYRSVSGSGTKKEVARDANNVRSERTIAEKAAVEPNSAIRFTDAGGNPAVLVRTAEGKFVAYSAVCPHEGCTVAYRRDIQKLVCPCHGSIFDPAEGAKVEAGPARQPLAKLRIHVENGEVTLA
jgi:Rieske Fe-S protein